MTYELSLKNAKTYFIATIFVIGNILLPQLCHLVPKGGLIFLPIYFFTLIGAYKYGLSVGLLTAILSPITNHLLFGMPPSEALVAILIKSSFLALSASWMATKFKGVSLLGVVLAVVGYQICGGVYELVFKGLDSAIQDFVIGWPGIVIQIFGGFLVLKSIEKL